MLLYLIVITYYQIQKENNIYNSAYFIICAKGVRVTGIGKWNDEQKDVTMLIYY